MIYFLWLRIFLFWHTEFESFESLIWISSRRVGATYKTCKNMPLTFFFLVWGPSTDIKPNWYLNSHTNCNFQVHFNIEVERNRSSVSKDDYFCELYSFFCFAGKVTRKIVPPGLRYEEITFADNQCIFDFRTTSPIWMLNDWL